LDLFPSQVIGRVAVAKTFTPDQPGTYTGGGINIVTKTFPEKAFFALTLGVGYNTQASLNGQFLTYNGGRHDWAAMDDGTRALPELFDSLAPIGADPKTQPAIPPVTQGNVPTNSVNLANNVKVNELTKSLGPAEFAPHTENAPLNQNFAFAGGNTIQMLDHPFGYFVSGSYKHDFNAYQDGLSQRYEGGTLGESQLKNSYTDNRSISTVNWSGMVTLSYEPIEKQELGFLFFYNQNSVDDARVQSDGIETYSPGASYRKFNLFWTQRNLQTYQLNGSHLLESLGDLQFNWLLGLTKTSQDEPDARFFNDVNTGSGYTTENATIPSPNKPTRYFRQLDENNKNLKLDWTLPFKNWTTTEAQFKFGALFNNSERGFTERQIYYNQGWNVNSPGYYYNDPNQFLTDAQVNGATFVTNANGRTINVRFNKYIQSYDSYYDGESHIPAGYLMLDLPVVSSVRLVGGARYESTDLQVFSASYLDSSITGTNINQSTLSQSDLLPSVGLIYAITPKMNLRLNYSQTIARPSYRELAAVYGYDPIISEFIEGNPLLKMTAIQNYDVRWEWFPRPGEVISFSAFYKTLENAIERGNVDTAGEVISFFNRDQASLYGVEMEARKNLDFLGEQLHPFSIGGNLSLIQSEVQLTADELSIKRRFFPDASGTRPLYDQSPYILNFDLSYDNLHSGTSASVIFNVNGPRITIAKLNTEDVYEQPAPTLDFVLSQKISTSLTMKFAAKNLLNPVFERTYGENSDLIYSSYRKGMTFSLNFNYEF
jgi:TonB-dependent receptor